MQSIQILLSMVTADALSQFNSFQQHVSHGLRQLAEETLGVYLSLEGLHKLGELTNEAIKLEEAIGKLSKTSGVSVNTLVGLHEAAQDTGTDFEVAKTTVAKLSANIYEAATAGGKAADAFREMGVSLVDADGYLRNTDAIVKDFLTKFREMPDGPQKIATAMALTGRSAKDAIPFLNEAAEAIQHVQEVGSPITPEAVEQAMFFEKNIRRLHEVIEMLFVELANRLLPSLINLSNQFLDASKQAQAHAAVVETLVGAFKGVITVAAILGFTVYEIGRAFGDAAAIIVEQFNIALETTKLLIKDAIQLIAAFVKLLDDMTGMVVAAFKVQQSLLSGNLSEAKSLIVGQFTAIKDDVKNIVAGVNGAYETMFDGFGKAVAVQNSVQGKYINDLQAQWTNLSKFVKDLWGGAKAEMPGKEEKGEQAAFKPVSQNSIRDLSQLNQLITDIYKQQRAMIESDPFKSQAEKIREMLPLLEQQRTLLIGQYEAARAMLDNPNLSEEQRLKITKDLVKLQGELNQLERDEQNIKLKGDFVGQMQTGLIKLNDRITDFAGNSAQLALTTMQRLVDAVGSSIFAAMQGTKNWGEAFSRAMSQAAQGIIQMVSQYIAGKLAMMAVDTVFSTKSKTESAQTTATAIPAGIAKAGEQGGWVGILIYVGVFLAAMAALMAIASAVGRERGGPVTRGTPYVVGEKRPELFIPTENGYIHPEVPSASLGGMGGGMDDGGSGGAPINLHFHGDEAAAMKAMRSQEGQNFIVDTNRKHVRRIASRS
jgi:phage-related protein/Arc/MetJ-type ribon-helix-helix transcriptional regulator